MFCVQAASEPFPINRNQVVAPDLTAHVRPAMDTSEEPPRKFLKPNYRLRINTNFKM